MTHSLQRPCRCPHCNYSVTRYDALRIHIETVHTRDLRHKCAECSKEFARASELKSHFFIHYGEKPYTLKTNERF
ncbi:hypothetical protein JTE90_029327 [Oedothorax gibbosus]|uniref:C2H2-type domain-containing protein n=1 Tax=Oedothorax gibbosus TaxID=931172 RepID=A0AAV6UHT6_9ARAC|nr:hypothetical protein JTE90_029327 [Oedothorax gibbosus]